MSVEFRQFAQLFADWLTFIPCPDKDDALEAAERAFIRAVHAERPSNREQPEPPACSEQDHAYVAPWVKCPRCGWSLRPIPPPPMEDRGEPHHHGGDPADGPCYCNTPPAATVDGPRHLPPGCRCKCHGYLASETAVGCKYCASAHKAEPRPLITDHEFRAGEIHHERCAVWISKPAFQGLPAVGPCAEPESAHTPAGRGRPRVTIERRMDVMLTSFKHRPAYAHSWWSMWMLWVPLASRQRYALRRRGPVGRGGRGE